MNILEKLSIAGSAAIIIVMILAMVGWTMNIVKLVQLDFQSPYKAEVIRGAGTALGYGAIIGWLHIED
jgi:hypothetical protein